MFSLLYILTSIIHPPVVLAGLCCTGSRDSVLRTAHVDPCHLAVSLHAWTPCTGRAGRWRENHRTGQRHLARRDDARSGLHGAVVGKYEHKYGTRAWKKPVNDDERKNICTIFKNKVLKIGICSYESKYFARQFFIYRQTDRQLAMGNLVYLPLLCCRIITVIAVMLYALHRKILV